MTEGKVAAPNLEERNDELAKRIAEKLSVPGRTLEAKMRRAGRRLPKRLRREGRYLAEMAPLQAHPKLSSRIDLPRVEAAFRNFHDHLDGIDPADRRWGFFLGMLGGLAFNLLLLAGLLIAFLAWRGDIGLG